MEEQKNSQSTLPPEVPKEPNELPDDINHDAVQPPKPKSKKKWLWLGLGLSVLVAGAAYWFVTKGEPQPAISSYEECVAAGYPVMESYPEQCAVPGGQSFTRQLSEEEKNRLNEAQLSESDNKYTSSRGVGIIVDSPSSTERVSSPLEIRGQIPGNWSFEGVFPIKLLDSLGNTLAEGQGQIEGDWMSESLLPFSAELEFKAESGAGITLILMKDNPSGLAENDDDLRIELIVE